MRKRITDPRYTAAVIPTSVIAGVVVRAGALGLDPQTWFAGSGLNVDACVRGAHISFREAARILKRALRVWPDEPLGLHIGSRDPQLSFGVLASALTSCRSFGDALDIGLRHHQVSGSLMDVAIERSPNSIALRLRERFPEPALLPFLCEEVCASSFLIARATLGSALRPLRLELSYPAPPHVDAYRRLFGCPLVFDADANRLVFDAVLLERPLAAYDPAHLEAALALCRHQLAAAPSTRDVVQAVERLLGNASGQRRSMQQIAQHLHLSERSLRRHLTDAGTSFSQTRDRVLEQRARTLLKTTHRPIAAIAADLGFSDGREFRRAFQRWTGLAPRTWRRR